VQICSGLGKCTAEPRSAQKKTGVAVPVRCLSNEVKGYITGVRWYLDWKKVKARIIFFDLFGGVKCLLVFLVRNLFFTNTAISDNNSCVLLLLTYSPSRPDCTKYERKTIQLPFIFSFMHNLVHCYAQRRPISLQLADFGKRFPSTVFRSLSILLVLLIFVGFGDGVRGQALTVNPSPSSGSSSPSAGGGNCGVFSKPIGIPENYSGDLYYDRFGNIWTETEITDLSANVVEECTAGVFKLSFSGNYTSDEKTTVCEVFTYLSGQVGGNNPVNGVVPIKIEFEGLGAGIGGEASLFYVLDCGILKNMPLANIRTKSNLLPLGFYAALIKINEGVNWYTGATVPNISNWNSDPAYLGKTDLYTAVLHEALHTLGFASTYGGVKTSDGTILPDVYTEYDKHLYQKTGNTIPLSQLPNYKKLIIPANDPICCSKHKKNEGAPTDFDAGCEDQIFFGQPNFFANIFTEFAEVSNASSNPDPGNIDEINNKLSHLDIDCNGGNLPFVMHPGLPASPATHSYPRRAITSPERDILNRIGYVTSSCAIQLGDEWRLQYF
jgi:hypothetical protein